VKPKETPPERNTTKKKHRQREAQTKSNSNANARHTHTVRTNTVSVFTSQDKSNLFNLARFTELSPDISSVSALGPVANLREGNKSFHGKVCEIRNRRLVFYTLRRPQLRRGDRNRNITQPRKDLGRRRETGEISRLVTTSYCGSR
jgi:hypothetical protein